MHDLHFTEVDRLKSAYADITATLDKYNVEWCGEGAFEIWLELKQPELKIVDSAKGVGSAPDSTK